MNLLSLFGAIVTALGIGIVLGADKKLQKLDRYEFENRSSGGVVGFQSYEEKIIHEKKHRSAKRQVTLALWVMIVGVGLFLRPFFF